MGKKIWHLNCKGQQKNMPQNVGSIKDLTTKNIHWVDEFRPHHRVTNVNWPFFNFVWSLQPVFNLMIDVHVMVLLATQTLRERERERERERGGGGGGGGERSREREGERKKLLSRLNFFCRTLTWLKEKELEQEIKKKQNKTKQNKKNKLKKAKNKNKNKKTQKNQRRRTSLATKHENFKAVVRKWEILAGVK